MRTIIVGLFAIAGCGPKVDTAATRAETPPVVVTVAPVQTLALRRSVAVVGTLNGFEEAVLSPKVDGRIVAVRADIGDRVAPGAVLLALDSRDYELAIREAKQALVAELAKVGLTMLPAGELNVEAVPSVRRVAATVEDAERRLKVKADLVARNAASKDEYDLVETELKIAVATRNQMETEARAILATARHKQATLEIAEQRLNDCTLTAPIPSQWAAANLPAGGAIRYAVAARMVSEGEMVRSMPVTNAFRLVLDFQLKLKAAVPERYVADVNVGQPVDVTTDAYPGRTFAGKVARVNPTVDALNRTFSVEIEVPNADGALKCGGFAKAAILTKTDNAVRTVPPSAVVTFAGVTKVFVVEGTKAKAVEVTFGTRDREWIEIIGPLATNARVATSGQTQLVDGASVRVRE